ncbi:hypothetical protein D3C72_2099250 [compost metagenome]
MDAVIRPVRMCLIMMFSCFAGCLPADFRPAGAGPVPTAGVALPARMFSSLRGDFKH